jgi:hypothetical protein
MFALEVTCGGDEIAFSTLGEKVAAGRMRGGLGVLSGTNA